MSSSLFRTKLFRKVYKENLVALVVDEAQNMVISQEDYAIGFEQNILGAMKFVYHLLQW